MAESTFQPNWASPIGETITRLMGRADIYPLDLAKRMRMTVSEVRAVIAGVEPVSSEVAEGLSAVLGGSAAFWKKRDADFRQSVSTVPIERRYDATWLKLFPFSELAEFGWLSGAKSEQEKAKQLLEFFGIQHSTQWKFRYPESSSISAFRTSRAYDTRHESVSSWLRQGERIAGTIECANWDPKIFRDRLCEIRTLTKNRYPRRFFPELRRICAECGVALVAAPTPAGCPASGATQFLTHSKAMMMVSFRFKTDDQFWFSFFHEAGHLLLHDIDSVFIDDNLDVNDSKEEVEANAFAQEVLIPNEYRSAMLNLPRRTDAVIRYALRIGLAPGIVVGQMQKAGTLPYKYLQGLKRRYSEEEVRETFTL